jgi:GTPase SAR1 family protein
LRNANLQNRKANQINLTASKVHHRIVLTGASGVGKTTLASSLATEIKLPLIPELARQICEERGFKRIGEIPDQEAFKRDVLDTQIKLEASLPQFVADRGTIDSWVLWERWNICQAMTYDSEAFYARCREQAQKSYTHVIYIPPLFTPPEDDFRWTDADYLKQIDRLIRLALYDFNLLERTYTVTSADPQSRLKEVTAWLNG